MFAEVKDKNKILINRLDDTERILVKELVEASKEDTKKVTITEILDENGDFGGLFLEVIEK